MSELNKNRRNLLKFLLIGGGVLLLGKVFGSSLLKLPSGSKVEEDSKNFQITEDKGELILTVEAEKKY